MGKKCSINDEERSPEKSSTKRIDCNEVHTLISDAFIHESMIPRFRKNIDANILQILKGKLKHARMGPQPNQK